MLQDIKIKDFYPLNFWETDKHGDFWSDTNVPIWLIDNTTDRKYLNETKSCVRLKCALLVLGTPIVHSISPIVNIAYKILKITKLTIRFEFDEPYSLKDRIKDMGRDLLKIALAPITLVGLELSALFGVLSPYNGRKLYASFERAQYGNKGLLAPCFQPEAKAHALGGNLEDRDAW